MICCCCLISSFGHFLLILFLVVGMDKPDMWKCAVMITATLFKAPYISVYESWYILYKGKKSKNQTHRKITNVTCNYLPLLALLLLGSTLPPLTLM